MMRDYFSSILKIAAQAFPLTAALAQWLSEIEAAEVDARLSRLEDPLAKYGPGARELCRILYSLIRAQPQDVATNHLDWTGELQPFLKEMRHFEADGLLKGSHTVGGPAFAHGFRLGSAFTVYLATLHEEPTKLGAIAEQIENATQQLNGFTLQQSTGVPLMVINALFADYAARGQGVKSETIGSSIYIPHR